MQFIFKELGRRQVSRVPRSSEFWPRGRKELIDEWFILLSLTVEHLVLTTFLWHLYLVVVTFE